MYDVLFIVLDKIFVCNLAERVGKLDMQLKDKRFLMNLKTIKCQGNIITYSASHEMSPSGISSRTDCVGCALTIKAFHVDHRVGPSKTTVRPQMPTPDPINHQRVSESCLMET